MEPVPDRIISIISAVEKRIADITVQIKQNNAELNAALTVCGDSMEKGELVQQSTNAESNQIAIEETVVSPLPAANTICETDGEANQGAAEVIPPVSKPPDPLVFPKVSPEEAADVARMKEKLTRWKRVHGPTPPPTSPPPASRTEIFRWTQAARDLEKHSQFHQAMLKKRWT